MVRESDVGPLRPALCERADRSDVVRDLFCADSPPEIVSLAALQAALGFASPVGAKVDARTGSVFLAHTTSLSADLVSEINPRAVIMAPGLFLAFNRGVQQVEIASVDRARMNAYNFYLLEFRQACNAAADGCGPGDLYTERIESSWRTLTLADDEDLKNTVFDCRQCHQRGSEQPKLLMREYYTPWTHYFGPDVDEPTNFPEPTGSALLRDYLRAQGDSAYANVPVDVIKHTNGITLELLVDSAQPLLFESSKIIGERWPWRDGAYAKQPERSATWDNAFVAWKRGEQLALPFYASRATDPGKQAQLSAALQRYRSGEIDAAELPDLADTFPDDPQLRAEIGLQTDPRSSAAETLIQACGACHNDVLDQSVSRARFNIALGRMARNELDVAIARISAQPTAAGAMPPRGRRQIAADKVQELIEYLKSSVRAEEDNALLDNAARMGMAGGAKRYP
ncbi:MAG TPA: hypothetical protein VFN67_41810 [Polyangiales bacterium]|nr:hypothetical protein [Polyangiales bacterium]